MIVVLTFGLCIALAGLVVIAFLGSGQERDMARMQEEIQALQEKEKYTTGNAKSLQVFMDNTNNSITSHNVEYEATAEALKHIDERLRTLEAHKEK